MCCPSDMGTKAGGDDAAHTDQRKDNITESETVPLIGLGCCNLAQVPGPEAGGCSGKDELICISAHVLPKGDRTAATPSKFKAACTDCRPFPLSHPAVVLPTRWS